MLEFIELLKGQDEIQEFVLFPNPSLTREHYKLLVENLSDKCPMKAIQIWESSEYNLSEK